MAEEYLRVGIVFYFAPALVRTHIHSHSDPCISFIHEKHAQQTCKGRGGGINQYVLSAVGSDDQNQFRAGLFDVMPQRAVHSLRPERQTRGAEHPTHKLDLVFESESGPIEGLL